MNAKHNTLLWACSLALAVTLSCGLAWTAEAPKGDPDLLGTCPMSGKTLAGLDKAATYTHEGRELRFCGAGCVEAFKKDPDTHLKKIDAAVVKQQLPHYPLDACLVSGGKLGAMGDPVDHVYKNRLVRFCCQGCIGKFEKEPAKYLAKLDEAVIEKQKADYPLTTCPVMGGAIAEGKAIDYVAGNRLVRFCCPGCIAAFEKEPAKYLKKIDAAG